MTTDPKQTVFQPADRAEELDLVEAVRAELGLEPLAVEAMQRGADYMSRHGLHLAEVLVVDDVVIP